jgi:hypothetical protein
LRFRHCSVTAFGIAPPAFRHRRSESCGPDPFSPALAFRTTDATAFGLMREARGGTGPQSSRLRLSRLPLRHPAPRPRTRGLPVPALTRCLHAPGPRLAGARTRRMPGGTRTRRHASRHTPFPGLPPGTLSSAPCRQATRPPLPAAPRAAGPSRSCPRPRQGRPASRGTAPASVPTFSHAPKAGSSDAPPSRPARRPAVPAPPARVSAAHRTHPPRNGYRAVAGLPGGPCPPAPSIRREPTWSSSSRH